MSSGNASKWLLRGVIAGLGAAGASLIAYVTEHGELPEWMPKAFDWIWSGVTVSTPWALWELLIFVLIPAVPAVYLLQTEGQKVFRLEDQITALQQQLKKVKTENSDLLAENNRLKLPPPPEPDEPSQLTLNERQYNLLMIIAECENESVITTSSNLLQVSKLQKLVLNSTLDDLIGFGYIVRIKMTYDNKYQLTVIGRKFVVTEQKA